MSVQDLMHNDGIADKIDDALSDSVTQPATLQRTESTFDPGTGETTTTDVGYECQALDTEYSQWSIANTDVKANDRKIILPQKSLLDSSGGRVVPTTDDEIKYEGDVFTIVDVSSDPADAIWEVQARR